MSYTLTLTPESKEDIEKLTAYYSGKFSTGAGDFLDAIVDTFDSLLLNPSGYQVRFIDHNGFSRRGIKVKAKPGSKNYAKRFPYLVLYHIDENHLEVVITEVFPTDFPEDWMRGRIKG